MSTTPNAPISAKDVETALNTGISTNYPASTSVLTFNDTLVRTLASKPTTKSPISMNDMRSKAGPVASGTVLSSSCAGSTLTQTIADGRYGSSTVTTANSPSCRYRETSTIAVNSNGGMAYYFDAAHYGSLYKPGMSDLVITINPGVIVGISASTIPCFNILNASPGDTVTIYNYGTIVGGGGQGGGGGINGRGGDGFAGGTAIKVTVPVTIYNYGIIAGGGGGGGGGAGSPSAPASTHGGGGGAGYGPSYGGGSYGTATAGGAGAPATSTGAAGGDGGGWASAGSAGGSFTYLYITLMITAPGGAGGAGGLAVEGKSNITWGATGTIYGGQV